MVTFEKVNIFYYILTDEERMMKKLANEITSTFLSIYKDEIKDQGFLTEDIFPIEDEEIEDEETEDIFPIEDVFAEEKKEKKEIAETKNIPDKK